MSIEASRQVWRARGLTRTTKMVLLKLADHADPSGANAYPSVARIAAECATSTRTVQRALRELVDNGYARITAREDARTHKPRTYQITTDAQTSPATPTPRKGDNTTTPRATPATPRSVQINHQDNHQDDDAREQERRTWEAHEATFGAPPGKRDADELAEYTRTHGADAVVAAYKRAAIYGAEGWPYIRAILNNTTRERRSEAKKATRSYFTGTYGARLAAIDAAHDLTEPCAHCGQETATQESIAWPDGMWCRTCATRAAQAELKQLKRDAERARATEHEKAERWITDQLGIPPAEGAA
ncbi:MAG: helix-turn-helix domain-containing protein [Chloroflexi bacterium]|nr:helix-turn-helix domain-containing protein [Chloroflexota bacterium]